MSSGDGVSRSSSKNSEKPAYSRFSQQELPACKPILTPGLVMTTFVVLEITFIPIGLSHLSASDNVVELIDRYDEDCIPTDNSNGEAAQLKRIEYIQDAGTNKSCIRTITVPKKMKNPIFVYYQLDEFYQNHRRYVKSRSDAQYRNPEAYKETRACEPEALVNDTEPIVPCGLIAWSLFNDTYSLSRNGVALPINKMDIAWGSDKTRKFGSNVYPKNFQGRNLTGGASLTRPFHLVIGCGVKHSVDVDNLNQQEDLLVWMRPAALPIFLKLVGKIETDLEASEVIKVEIQNNYNTYSFKANKKLVISTTTWIGGKNDFLGKCYILVGGACLLIAIAYIIAYLIKPRPLGDPSYLSWNKNPASTQ